MKWQKTTDVYFNQTVKDLVKNLSERVKYTKILLLNESAFNTYELKQDLEKNQIHVVEIVLDSTKNVELFTLSQILLVNEDIRAILTVDQKFITVAKYVSEIKGVPCYIFCQGVIHRSHCLDIYIKNNNRFDKFEFTQQLNVHILNDEKGIENSVCTLICNTVSLLDYIIRQNLTDETIDFKTISEALSIIRDAIESLSKNKSDEFIKNVWQVDLLLSELEYNHLPSFEVASLLTGGVKDVRQKASFCKQIINRLSKLMMDKAKNKVINVDYSARLIELCALFNVDRLQNEKALISQIKQIKAVCINELTCDIKPVVSLATRLLGVVEKKEKLCDLTTKEQKALEYSGDTYLGINCVSAIREFFN